MSKKHRKKYKNDKHSEIDIPVHANVDVVLVKQDEEIGDSIQYAGLEDTGDDKRVEISEVKKMSEPRGFSFGGLINFVSNFLILASVVALGAGAYLFFYYQDSPREISIKLDAPEKIYTGIPFKVKAEINNGSESFLQEGVLSFDLPDDIVFIGTSTTDAGGSGPQEILGEIEAKSLQKKEFTFLPVFSGEAGKGDKERIIGAGFSYTLGKSGGFEVKAEKEMRLEKPAIELNIETEGQVVGGSTFEIKLNYKNSAGREIPSLNLKVGYPNRFRLVESDIEPYSLNNYWKFGSLKAGAKGKLSLEGRLEGMEGTAFEFPITFLGEFGEKEYTIYEETLRVGIAPSPLGLQVFVNGSENYTARLGDSLEYAIHYKNMSGIALQNVVITATLRGDMIDFNSIQTDGVLDTSRGAVRWESGKVPALGNVDAGDSGKVSFRVKLDNKYPINRFGDKNFNIQMKVEASSPSVPFYVSGDRTKSEKEVATKIGGMVLVDAKGFYRDAGSGIANSGELPPKVGAMTQYTVHWILRNFGTDVSSVLVKAPLQPGARWTGNVRSNAEGAVPTLNEATQEVYWEIAKIPATRGAIGEPVLAVFQFEAVPDVSYVGKFQPLLGATSLTAMDDFTGVTLEASDLLLSTNLIDDSTVGTGQGVVQP